MNTGVQPITARLALFLASFGYVGYCPVAPGTAGSAAALVLFGVVRLTGSWLIEAGVLAVCLVAGTWSAGVSAQHLNVDDPGVVVIDEVAGMLVTLAFWPVGWAGALAGFVIFRVFDIIKPYPCARAERLPAGWGIMADDVVAGLYGNVILRLVTLWVPGWL